MAFLASWKVAVLGDVPQVYQRMIRKRSVLRGPATVKRSVVSVVDNG